MRTQPVITGNTEVLDAFYKPERRLAIITCAGGNRNAMTSGAFISLRRLKLIHRPIAFAGISSGIATNAYFMGDGKATDARVFSHDMSDDRIFALRRIISNGYAFDVDYVERVFTGIETNRGIRAENVVRHHAPLYAVLAHAETGEAKVYCPENAHDVWRLASYGSAITGFARPLTYRGIPITDGYFTTEQLPVSFVTEKEQPTDILVFAGTHFNQHPKPASLLEQAFYKTGLAKASKPVQELIKTRHIRFMKTANEVVARKDVRVCIIWVPEKLSPVKIDTGKSRQLISLGFHTMEHLLNQRHL